MVRMMGLSSHRAALLAGFAVRNPPVASRVLLLPKNLRFSGTPIEVGSSPHHTKTSTPQRGVLVLVRMMGLEPTGYCYH